MKMNGDIFSQKVFGVFHHLPFEVVNGCIVDNNGKLIVGIGVLGKVCFKSSVI